MSKLHCSALHVMKPIFMQNLKKCVGTTVIEFRLFNWVLKEEREEHCEFVKITFMNILHILHQITSNFL